MYENNNWFHAVGQLYSTPEVSTFVWQRYMKDVDAGEGDGRQVKKDHPNLKVAVDKCPLGVLFITVLGYLTCRMEETER